MDGSEELVVNPHSELRVLRAGGAPSAVVVQSQRRGAHRTVATVARIRFAVLRNPCPSSGNRMYSVRMPRSRSPSTRLRGARL